MSCEHLNLDQPNSYTVLLAAAPKAMTLYEVMAAAGIVGWDAAQDLKYLCRIGLAVSDAHGGTTYYASHSC